MNSFRSGLPDTFSARDSPAASVMSVKIGPAPLAGWSPRATAARCDTAARQSEPPSSRRNPRRDDACLRALLTRAVRRCSRGAPRHGPPLLVELVGLALEALEHLERLLALVRPPEATVHAAQHVIVRRRARIEGDRAVQRANRVVEPALALVGATALEPRAIGLGIELDRPSSVSERLVGIVRAVVVGAQVGVRRSERAFAFVVQGGRLLVHRHRAGVVAE